MARSMGVSAIRVEKPSDVDSAIRTMLAHPGPFLVDLILQGDIHPEMIGLKCGQ